VTQLLAFGVLELVLVGVLLVGLLMIGLALVSLLRKFVPGSSPATEASGQRRDLVAVGLSLGWGLAAFGLVGLLLVLAGVEATMSIVIGLGAGLLLAFAILTGLIYLRRPVTSLDPLDSEGIVGQVARVIIAVPSTGLGEIQVATPGGPVNLAARSVGAEPLPEGLPVVVERYSNRVAIVRMLGD
jgi:hypothetical protein